MDRRAVITGLGVVCACGIGKNTFWENSVKGKSFIVDYNDTEHYSSVTRAQGNINGFRLLDSSFKKREFERMGRHTQFAMRCVDEALHDSKLDLEVEDRERIGVCIANAIADTPCSERQFLRLKQSMERESRYGDIRNQIDKDLYSKAMFSCLSTEISGRYGCKGNVLTMSTGCTGGIDAIGYSFESIQRGEVDVMIAGGSEAPISGMTLASFDAIGAISNREVPANKASSPFALYRDGFVLAEGCGIVILEELDHALKRGAKIYGEVLSFTTINNAYHMTDLPSNGEALAKVIKMALNRAKVEPKEVDYISAHGSSTQQNDLCETSAYKEIFGDYVYDIPISSMKSIVGHPLAAASAIEIVHCCQILEHGVLPPTVNLDVPDPKCDLDYVPNTARKKKVDTILKDASGFSGIHSAMIISR